MNQITCYIRGSRHDNLIYRRLMPWTMETYPDFRNRNKHLHRRDFDCRNIGEARKIAKAVYGRQAKITF
jgi:hypothetical protein